MTIIIFFAPLVGTVFLLLILSWIWPPDSPWAPWWQVNKKKAQEMCKLANVKQKDTVYELGSGDAISLIVAAKEFGAKGVGIEIDPLRSQLSKLRIKKAGVSKMISIKRKNFFDEDISNATVVFVYLIPKALNRLLPKFKKELKKGTRIMSFRYEVPLPIKKHDKKNELFLYVV